MTTNSTSLQGEAMVADWQSSGLPQVEYARMKNIKIHTFRYWLYKRNKKTRHSEAFVELKNIFKGNDILLRYPNGVELHVPSGTTLQALKSLIYL
jgi:hypothetical protein